MFLIDTLQTGGTEKSILEIASRFRQLSPILVHSYPGEELKPCFIAAGIPVYTLQLEGKYQFIKGIRSFSQLLRREQPALVVATLMRSEIIARLACRLENIPLISTFVNDTYSPHDSSNYSPIEKTKKQVFKWLDQWTAPLATHFLANARSIKESNARALGISPENISVIYRGRNLTLYKDLSLSKSQQEITFINVGRLIPRKGQEEMIRAFARFCRKYPSSQLKIAGEGNYRPHLEQVIRDAELKEKVHLLGNIKAIPNLLEQSSCFVFPSHYEGFSGALIEAMMAGLPILASDIPMNREAVHPDETGRLFPVKNEQGIFEAMCWFAENQEEGYRMGARARSEALERFDIKKIAAQHEQLYLRIIKEFRKNNF